MKFPEFYNQVLHPEHFKVVKLKIPNLGDKVRGTLTIEGLEKSKKVYEIKTFLTNDLFNPEQSYIGSIHVYGADSEKTVVKPLTFDLKEVALSKELSNQDFFIIFAPLIHGQLGLIDLNDMLIENVNLNLIFLFCSDHHCLA